MTTQAWEEVAEELRRYRETDPAAQSWCGDYTEASSFNGLYRDFGPKTWDATYIVEGPPAKEPVIRCGKCGTIPVRETGITCPTCGAMAQWWPGLG